MNDDIIPAIFSVSLKCCVCFFYGGGGAGAQYFWIQWQWFFPGSCSNIPSVRLQLKLFLNIRSGSVRLTRSSNTRILLARGNPGRCQRLISLNVPDSNVCRSKRHVWTAVISCKFRAKNVSPPVLICLSCLFYFIDSWWRSRICRWSHLILFSFFWIRSRSPEGSRLRRSLWRYIYTYVLTVTGNSKDRLKYNVKDDERLKSHSRN